MNVYLPHSVYRLQLSQRHGLYALVALAMVAAGLVWVTRRQPVLQAQVVPYDAYARPYSWPMTGKILQDYGFTDQAQNLGSRYPGLYPKGDPNTVFSKTNHTTPPETPSDKFLNPNIDIAPNTNDAGSRAVYATHAGWLTFADWAGEGKGYAIQIESDVDGDGQSDYATRYMHLQAPQNGQFAPDIPVLPASTAAEPVASTTTAILPSPFSVEAEGMDRSDPSITVVKDSTASGGEAVAFSANGTITSTVTQRADELTIYARGTDCLGSPELVVKQDGLPIGTITVNSTTDWASYSLNAAFDGGAHRISLEFDNAFSLPLTCARTVQVDRIQFIILNPNAPVTTVSGKPVILEAEDLTSDSAKKPQVKTATDASPEGQGKYLEFFSNGEAHGSVEVPQANWIIVRTKGDQCGGAPHLSLKVDNAEVFSLDVKATTWTDYSTSFSLNQGVEGNKHQVSISYTNDKVQLAPPCDRNLLVDRIVFEQVTTAQSTTNSNSLIGKTKYVAFNQLIGYVSTNRTYEHSDADVSKIPNANQSYLSYRIMYNNPNSTTFPTPDQTDDFVEARVDNPYITETDGNTIAGSLRDIFDEPGSPMYFFCANRQRGEAVRCIYAPNPV